MQETTRTTTAKSPELKRSYETPKLVRYGSVKELTAGTKLGVNDISLNSSIV